MREFINEFGKENFTIIAIVILVILIALVLIVLLEKGKLSKSIKNNYVSNSDDDLNSNSIEEELKHPEKHLDYKPLQALRNIEKMEDTLKYREIKALEETKKQKVPVYQKPEVKREYHYDNYHISDNVKPSYNPKNLEVPNEDVVYKKRTVSKEEAKEKLEEVTKKLVKEPDVVDHTVFEEEQEEKSIISYDELIKASHDIDDKNDKLLEDEMKAAITLEELYKKDKKENKDNRIRPNVEPVPNRTNKRTFRYENISPVFGTGKSKPKKEIVDKYKEIKNSSSDDFLEKLKNFMNKLD